MVFLRGRVPLSSRAVLFLRGGGGEPVTPLLHWVSLRVPLTVLHFAAGGGL